MKCSIKNTKEFKQLSELLGSEAIATGVYERNNWHSLTKTYKGDDSSLYESLRSLFMDDASALKVKSAIYSDMFKSVIGDWQSDNFGKFSEGIYTKSGKGWQLVDKIDKKIRGVLSVVGDSNAVSNFIDKFRNITSKPQKETNIGVDTKVLEKAGKTPPISKISNKYVNKLDYDRDEQVVDLELNQELVDMLKPVLSKLNSLGKNALVVGGAVRDALMGRKPKDIDVEVYGLTIDELENILSEFGKVDVVGKSFGVIKFIPYIDDKGTLAKLEEPFDFSVPRRENKVGVGHKGFSVEFDTNITEKEAALRRDFTWNGLAYNPLTKTLYDYGGGLKDLRDGILRHNSDKFEEDPLRILRAMQFQARYGFKIADETNALMRKMVERGDLDELPPSRIMEEWLKWAKKGRHHYLIFDFLRDSGVGERLYPELMLLKDTPQDPIFHPEGDVETHTKMVLKVASDIAEENNLNMDDKAVLIFSALFHDVAKPPTTKREYKEKLGRWVITSVGHEQLGAEYFERINKRSLHLPNKLADRIYPVIANHLAWASLKSINNRQGQIKAFRKLVKRLDKASVKDLFYLLASDMLGRDVDKGKVLSDLNEFIDIWQEYNLIAGNKKRVDVYINGKDLISLGYKQSKTIGVVLRELEELKLNGLLKDKESALKWASLQFARLNGSDISGQQLADFITYSKNTGEVVVLRKTDIESILQKLGIDESVSIDEVLNSVLETLLKSGKLIILDGFDNVNYDVLKSVVGDFNVYKKVFGEVDYSGYYLDEKGEPKIFFDTQGNPIFKGENGSLPVINDEEANIRYNLLRGNWNIVEQGESISDIDFGDVVEVRGLKDLLNVLKTIVWRGLTYVRLKLNNVNDAYLENLGNVYKDPNGIIHFMPLVKGDYVGRVITYRNASPVYRELASNPFLSNEEAYDLYITHSIIDTSLTPNEFKVGDEARIVYNVGNHIYFNIGDAIDAGGDIRVGVILRGESGKDFIKISEGVYYLENTDIFKSLVDIDTTNSETSFEGIIVDAIKNNLIKSRKILTHNGWVYEAQDGDKLLNAEKFKYEYGNYFATGGIVKYIDGTLKIDKDSYQSLRQSYMRSVSKTRQELLDEVAELVADGKELDVEHYGAMKDDLLDEYMGENTGDDVDFLKDKIHNFLNRFGISIESLESYKERYKERFGKDFDVYALADISGRIIALARGKATINDLTEEVAHFLIEMFGDQAKLNEILRDVEKSDEWAEWSEFYYSIYGDKYQGAELDNIVRREIAGKILANKILDRAKKTSNKEEYGLLYRLINFVKDVINKINSLFKSSELDNLLDDIADAFLNDDYSKFHRDVSVSMKNMVFFSARDERDLVTLHKARQVLEKRVLMLKKSRKSTAVAEAELSKLNEYIENIDNVGAVKVMVSTIDTDLSYMERVVRKLKKGESISYEDRAVYNRIINDYMSILPSLSGIVNNLDSYGVTKDIKERLVKQVENINKNILKIQSEFGDIAVENLDAFIDEYGDKMGLTEQQKDKLRKAIESEQKDITGIQKVFGQLQYARNVILRALGRIINDYKVTAHRNVLSRLNPYLKVIEQSGYKLSDFRDMLEKDDNGEYTSYLKNPLLLSKFYAEQEKARVDAYNQVFGTNYTVEEYRLAKKKGEIKNKSEWTREQINTFNDIMFRWRLENEEMPYLPEFYIERENLYKELGISDVTRQFLQSLSIRRNEVLSKYRREDGTVDYASISKSDLELLNTIDIDRRRAKSLYDDMTSRIKTGEELQIAEDLRKLDNYYAEKLKDKRGVRDEFFDTLESIVNQSKTGGVISPYEWFLLNAGFSYTSDFWEELEEIKKQRENDELEIIDIDVYEDVIKRIERYVEEKKELLSQYKSSYNPLEVSYVDMPQHVVERIREIEDTLRELYKELYRVAQSKNDVERKGENYEVKLSQQFYNEAIAKGLNKYEFLSEHLPSQKRIEYERLMKSLRRGKHYAGGLRDNIRLLNELYDFATDNGIIAGNYKSDQEFEQAIKDALFDEYSKYVYSYFKVFAPAGYSRLIEYMQENGENVLEVVNHISGRKQSKYLLDNFSETLDYLEIKPRFYWLDDSDNMMRNEKYFQLKDYGRSIPKVEKYLNNDFFKEYKVDKNTFVLTGQIKQTEFSNKFKVWKHTVDMIREGLRAYNEYGNYSVYRIPQVSKRSYERLYDVTKGKPFTSIGNAIRDLIYNRVDELGYGEQIDGRDVAFDFGERIIPKYFLRNLEEHSDVSTDLPYTIAVFLKAAFEYQEKLNSLNDVMLLEQNLLNQKFRNKDAKNSNAYEMFKEFVDAYFYGIKRNKRFLLTLPNGKQFDVSKFAMAFDRFVRSVNINFSVPIAATSYTTARIFKMIERVVGYYIGRDSMAFGRKEYIKLMPKYVNELGKLNRSSKLYLLGELFGVNDFVHKTADAGFSRGLRLFNDLPNAMNEMANFPIYNEILLSVLDDYRLVNGKFISYTQFKQLVENKDKSEAQLKELWKQYEDKTLYSMLEVNKDTNTIDFTDKAKQILDENIRDAAIQNASAKITRLAAMLDGIVHENDKSYATRHYLYNFLMAHRGWFTTMVQNVLKPRNFDFMTGVEDEGNYYTFMKMLDNVYKLKKTGDYANYIDGLRKEWAKLDPAQRASMKRVGTQMLVLMIMLGLSYAVIAPIADDDDNKDLWLVQFLSYLWFRTTNEVASVQAPFSVFNAVDMVDKPFVAWNTVKQLTDYRGYSLEEVQSGMMKGHTKLFAKIAKMTWLRHYYEMLHPDIKQRSYRYFNRETLLYLDHKFN